MNLFFEDACVHIYQDQGTATIKWLGLAKSPTYRQTYEQFLEMLVLAATEETPLNYWLFDCTEGKVIDIKDQSWTLIDWYEQLEAHTTCLPKRIAVILSKDIFNKIATRVIMSRIAQFAEAELAYFSEEEEAREWLMKPEEMNEELVAIA